MVPLRTDGLVVRTHLPLSPSPPTHPHPPTISTTIPHTLTLPHSPHTPHISPHHPPQSRGPRTPTLPHSPSAHFVPLRRGGASWCLGGALAHLPPHNLHHGRHHIQSRALGSLEHRQGLVVRPVVLDERLVVECRWPEHGAALREWRGAWCSKLGDCSELFGRDSALRGAQEGGFGAVGVKGEVQFSGGSSPRPGAPETPRLIFSGETLHAGGRVRRRGSGGRGAVHLHFHRARERHVARCILLLYYIVIYCTALYSSGEIHTFFGWTVKPPSNLVPPPSCGEWGETGVDNGGRAH